MPTQAAAISTQFDLDGAEVMTLGYFILFAIIGAASAYSMRRFRDEGTLPLRAENPEAVTVCYRKERVIFGAVMTVVPLIFLKKVYDEYSKPGHGDALLGVIFTLIPVSGGLWLFLFARRKMVFDREGARIVGLAPRGIPWTDLGSIRALHGSMLRFNSKDGKRFIDIDASMQGWPTLLRELPGLVEGEAKKIVARALEEIRAAARSPV